jgi:hypothetical protein
MAYKYQIILQKGFVIDPISKRNGIMDIGIANGKIVEIAPEINPTLAEENFDLHGLHVIPGLVDLHTHASAWLGGKYGHKMLAQAGVTTALDMSGPIESVLDIARDYGVGINIASIQYVRPEHTVSDSNPDNIELENLLIDSLSKGAIGLKLLGGHYPLTPEATARAIELVNKNGAYVAFHAGTTQKGSNIEGFLEAIELAAGNALHLAHINSYCRGVIKPCTIETEEAIKALEANPRIRSESYLSSLNGTSAKCTNGIPESNATKTCLNMGGFPATEAGLEEAIRSGWAQINMEAGGKMIVATGDEAVQYWREKATDTTVSFAVNPPEPRIRLAIAKRASGQFAVDCISTDGGGIPRNVIVEMGLSLVKLQALTMEEFVLKTSYYPAQILGLKNKGHLTLGADADITVINYKEQKPYMSIANGKVVMYKVYVCGQGSSIITTPRGKEFVQEKGLEPIVVNLPESAFYKGF